MSKKLPIATIIGRQNVGKSTLFNALIRERRAIVDPLPGLTRDIITYSINYKSVSFIISDTPGLDINKSSELSQSIIENARNHLKRSSVIIFLMENPSPFPFDLDLSRFIRKLSLPTIVTVNKMDTNTDLENMTNFYEMGYTDILPISALKKMNIDMLLDKITDILPVKRLSTDNTDLKISIVGRPNSGKSTLLNSLLGYERAIVSDIPGTTRDAIDEDISFHGKRIRVIDTAGLKKKSRIKGNEQFYSMRRTIDSINRSDVVIHLIDATIGLTETDKKISDEILKANKPIIISINKWDAVNKDTKTFEEYKEKIIYQYYRAIDFPIMSISALERIRIHKLMTTALELSEKSKMKIETSKLNDIIQNIQKMRLTPQIGRSMKIYYATQISTTPPQFKLFVNNHKLFKRDVIRFLQKALQERLDLKGIPIILRIHDRR
ncbi:MAG: ribosome biogenesis GTPase Der [Spirochaetota bacterium]|nr:ribosome biogenesis GTPase Der [Spirochaetota bacterium]